VTADSFAWIGASGVRRALNARASANWRSTNCRH
jgi:hypothetical protein